MEERFEEILGKYEFAVRNIARTRGAFVLDTDKGLHILRPWDVSKKRIEFENKVTTSLENRGYTGVDTIIPTREGQLISETTTGESYVVKKWFHGEECRVKEKEDLILAAGNLGQLHKMLCLDTGEEDNSLKEESLIGIFERHNREMKRICTYIRGKRQKNGFELCILKSFDEFYQRAVEGVIQLKELSFDARAIKACEEKQLCHGCYTYHNVLILRDGIATVNFEKTDYGLQLLDLYYFLRKVMEKNNWEKELGYTILSEYLKFHSLEKDEIKMLGVLLGYPEKYWKITNHYFNSKKSWIAEKDMDKLELVCCQEMRKTLFLKELFSLSI